MVLVPFQGLQNLPKSCLAGLSIKEENNKRIIKICSYHSRGMTRLRCFLFMYDVVNKLKVKKLLKIVLCSK